MRALLIALLSVAGCPSDPSCPSNVAAGHACNDFRAACSDDHQRCRCESGFWYCVDRSCPDDTRGWPTGGCEPSGLYCGYGPEETCTCLNGDWLCVDGTDSGVPERD